jgi:hypothetical protein
MPSQLTAGSGTADNMISNPPTAEPFELDDPGNQEDGRTGPPFRAADRIRFVNSRMRSEEES